MVYGVYNSYEVSPSCYSFASQQQNTVVIINDTWPTEMILAGFSVRSLGGKMTNHYENEQSFHTASASFTATIARHEWSKIIVQKSTTVSGREA